MTSADYVAKLIFISPGPGRALDRPSLARRRRTVHGARLGSLSAQIGRSPGRRLIPVDPAAVNRTVQTSFPRVCFLLPAGPRWRPRCPGVGGGVHRRINTVRMILGKTPFEDEPSTAFRPMFGQSSHKIETTSSNIHTETEIDISTQDGTVIIPNGETLNRGAIIKKKNQTNHLTEKIKFTRSLKSHSSRSISLMRKTMFNKFISVFIVVISQIYKIFSLQTKSYFVTSI